MEKTIQVNSPDGTYPIHIKTGILDTMTHYADLGLKTPPLVITDSNLESIHAQVFADKIGAGCAVMPAGESHKNLATVSRLYSDAIRTKLDRSSTIIAFGGGVVGDVAGFVAATYMRGVGFIQIPTSLLAMVDSSVGGKVGVDLPEGKNLVGAFKQPIAVYIDPAVLDTLPPREWGCGMAEIIKHGLLADETLLDTALHYLSRAEELVARAVQVKVDVVQRDPYAGQFELVAPHDDDLTALLAADLEYLAGDLLIGDRVLGATARLLQRPLQDVSLPSLGKSLGMFSEDSHRNYGK